VLYAHFIPHLSAFISEYKSKISSLKVASNTIEGGIIADININETTFSKNKGFQNGIQINSEILKKISTE